MNKGEAAVKCPKCGNSKTKVINSRPSQWSTVRIRSCEKCVKIFYTLEKGIVGETGKALLSQAMAERRMNEGSS